VQFIDNLSKKFPDDSIDIKGKEVMVERTIGTLMTYQLMFSGYFGTDIEFITNLVGMIRAIVRK
jgi:hypothetical protein